MLVVRYTPGASGRFCSAIIQNLISDYKSKVDHYGGMHNESDFPDIIQSHDNVEEIVDLFERIVQIVINRNDLPMVCSHFYYSCIKRWWDTKLLKMYHPSLDKKALFDILIQKNIPQDTLEAMIEYHGQYEYAFKSYPSEKVVSISLDCLLKGNPVQELLQYFPTDKDLSELNSMVKEYQLKHKNLY